MLRDAGGDQALDGVAGRLAAELEPGREGEGHDQGGRRRGACGYAEPAPEPGPPAAGVLDPPPEGGRRRGHGQRADEGGQGVVLGAPGPTRRAPGEVGLDPSRRVGRELTPAVLFEEITDELAVRRHWVSPLAVVGEPPPQEPPGPEQPGLHRSHRGVHDLGDLS